MLRAHIRCAPKNLQRKGKAQGHATPTGELPLCSYSKLRKFSAASSPRSSGTPASVCKYRCSSALALIGASAIGNNSSIKSCAERPFFFSSLASRPIHEFSSKKIQIACARRQSLLQNLREYYRADAAIKIFKLQHRHGFALFGRNNALIANHCNQANRFVGPLNLVEAQAARTLVLLAVVLQRMARNINAQKLQLIFEIWLSESSATSSTSTCIATSSLNSAKRLALFSP